MQIIPSFCCLILNWIVTSGAERHRTGITPVSDLNITKVKIRSMSDTEGMPLLINWLVTKRILIQNIIQSTQMYLLRSSSGISYETMHTRMGFIWLRITDYTYNTDVLQTHHTHNICCLIKASFPPHSKIHISNQENISHNSPYFQYGYHDILKDYCLLAHIGIDESEKMYWTFCHECTSGKT